MERALAALEDRTQGEASELQSKVEGQAKAMREKELADELVFKKLLKVMFWIAAVWLISNL